ncbi:MAG: LacI family transcriptional regulator, partial [Synergistaceae bacterium]|nr:LacI family transcriptional regulator [Synergistaceae bacterium]
LLAGVGKATVSRVINGKGNVSEATLRKVQNIIREKKYSPSAAAQNLSKRSNNIVGVIIPEAHNSFFAEILAGISNVADENDMVIFFCNTDNKAKKDVRALEMMFHQRVKGLIMTPAAEYSTADAGARIRRQLTGLAEMGAAIVLLDRVIPNFQCDGVYFNNLEGAYLATEALIKAGHERIGILAGDMSMTHGKQRYAGFEKAMKEYGLPIDDRYVLHGEFKREMSYEQTKNMLLDGDIPTAVFCSNNMSGAGFLQAVYDFGMKVPADIAYICFDKVEGVEIFGEKHSHISRDVVGMGEAAARLLIKRLRQPEKPCEQQVLPPDLRLYGSEVYAGSRGSLCDDGNQHRGGS